MVTLGFQTVLGGWQKQTFEKGERSADIHEVENEGNFMIRGQIERTTILLYVDGMDKYDAEVLHQQLPTTSQRQGQLAFFSCVNKLCCFQTKPKVYSTRVELRLDL